MKQQAIILYLDDSAVSCDTQNISLDSLFPYTDSSAQPTSGFKHLTAPLSSIGKSQRHNLVVSREFDL